MNVERPTRELVEAALARVGSPRIFLSSRDVLAAEVRALQVVVDAAAEQAADRHRRLRALAREWRSTGARKEGMALDALLDQFEDEQP